MKQRCFSIFMIVLCLSFAFLAHAETIEYYGGIDRENSGYKEFLEVHPDVALKQSGNYYNTTGEFADALLAKEFTSDLFELSTIQFDCQQIMKKGHCMDLSESHVIQGAVSRMHPVIVRQAIADGKLYGVPKGISFFYMQINQEGWTAAGLSNQDIPDSFPAFLNFLERWCDRVKASQVQNIHVIFSWDAGLYNEYSYTNWLTNLLIDSYITQVQFSGEPLRFNNPELSALLERCKAVGVRIYEAEPRIGLSGAQQDDYQLFENGLQIAWPQKASQILCFRINEAQPKIIKATLNMYAVNPNSHIQSLCIELLEKLVVGPESSIKWTRALLYQDAEPMIDPNYENTLQLFSGRVAAFEEQLKNPDLPLEKRLETEELLKRSEYYLAYTLTDKGKYFMSPAQLEDYNTYINTLYFPAPSAFDSSAGTLSAFTLLQKQYASGIKTIQQFIGELDRMAQMVEMENK